MRNYKSNKSSCNSCGAPVIWAKTKNDKNIPLDPKPVKGGNIELTENRALYVKAGEKELYVSHFATCPNASSHRRASK